jgi:uncharacterized protein YifN (PemK superfamily)
VSISEHPRTGAVLIADFSAGFREPEMVKRRPVIVISPKIRFRPGLCTVVALSTTAPSPILPFHCQIVLEPALPEPWKPGPMWVKGDMVAAIAFHRLDFFRYGKDRSGKRIYRYDPVSAEDLKRVRHCILCALGLASLTPHLP